MINTDPPSNCMDETAWFSALTEIANAAEDVSHAFPILRDDAETLTGSLLEHLRNDIKFLTEGYFDIDNS